jgi:sulfur carrier protein ThiS
MMQGSDEAIRVHIQFEAQLRDLVSSNPLTVSCPANSPVLAVLRSIDHSQAVFSRLFAAGGEFTSSVLVFLNDQPVTADQINTATVHDGDTLLLYPPISGG